MDTTCSSESMLSSEITASLYSHTAEMRLTKGCNQMLIKDLSDSTRNYLSKELDPETNACTDTDFLTMNWRGLAELMNFDIQDIENFEAHHPTMTKTKKVLAQFQTTPGSIVGVLWNFLLKLQRFDIIDGDVFRNKLEKDYANFIMRQKKDEEKEAELRKLAEQSNPVQVPNVSSNFEEPIDYPRLDAEADQYQQMVVEDVNKNQKTMFDAFVSYCHDDMNFVQEMIKMVEKVYSLKLCINARDLLPGSSQHFVTAKLIAERCRKVILVMSPSFLRSPECEFQVKVALSLSPGAKRKILIPILFRHCNMPLVLQHVCLVDYTKSDLAEWFWGRLAASLKESRGEKVLIPKEDLASLNNMEYDITKDLKHSNQVDINSVAKYNMNPTLNMWDESIPMETHHGPMEHTERFSSAGNTHSLQHGNRRNLYLNGEEVDEENEQRQIARLQSHQSQLPKTDGGYRNQSGRSQQAAIRQQQMTRHMMHSPNARGDSHNIHSPFSHTPNSIQHVQATSRSQREQGKRPMHMSREYSVTNTRADIHFMPESQSRLLQPSYTASSSREPQAPSSAQFLPKPLEDHFVSDDFDNDQLISREYSDIRLGQSLQSEDFEQSRNTPSFQQILPSGQDIQDYNLDSLSSRHINIDVDGMSLASTMSSGYGDYRIDDMSTEANICGRMVPNDGYVSGSITSEIKPKKNSSRIHSLFPRFKKSKKEFH